MMNCTSRGPIVHALAVTALALSGCATTEYVDQQVAGVQSQVTTHGNQIGALTERTNKHDTHLARLDESTAATAQLAAGKFNYEKVLEETILFSTGSFALSEEEKQKVLALAARLRSENRNRYVEVEGFADSRGDKPSNRILGVRRSYAVYDLLREQGVALNRITLISHGEGHPVAANNTASGMAQNRRVIITVVE